MMRLNKSIDKTAGVWVTNEKFDDGEDFKIKFKVSDVIDLSKDKKVKDIKLKDIHYNFGGRLEDKSETNNRVMGADLKYPILVVKNDDKIFAILDGTHRLQKAYLLKMEKIKAKVFTKDELKKFRVDNLNSLVPKSYTRIS